MTWTPLTTITVGQDWQLTPEIPLDLGYVRFKFPEAIGSVVRVAQMSLGEPNDIWDERRIVATATNQIHEFLAPPFFTDRTLALRVPNFVQSFEVEIEVSSMPISRGGVTEVTANSPTSASVTSSAIEASITSVELLAANADRKGFSIVNNSTAILYIDLDSSASTTSYTVALGQGDLYECPINYVGVVSGIWSAANGNAQVREFN
jgi:hypothetical protein